MGKYDHNKEGKYGLAWEPVPRRPWVIKHEDKSLFRDFKGQVIRFDTPEQGEKFIDKHFNRE